jgi:hypothetical protein
MRLCYISGAGQAIGDTIRSARIFPIASRSTTHGWPNDLHRGNVFPSDTRWERALSKVRKKPAGECING